MRMTTAPSIVSPSKTLRSLTTATAYSGEDRGALEDECAGGADRRLRLVRSRALGRSGSLHWWRRPRIRGSRRPHAPGARRAGSPRPRHRRKLSSAGSIAAACGAGVDRPGGLTDRTRRPQQYYWSRGQTPTPIAVITAELAAIDPVTVLRASGSRWRTTGSGNELPVDPSADPPVDLPQRVEDEAHGSRSRGTR